MEQNPFVARWDKTGSLLCHGKWVIHYQERALILPIAQCEQDMGTHGIYSFMDPDNPLFAEGLEENDWLIDNMTWLLACFADNDVPLDEIHMRWFYRAINPKDWRCGSCGGCI